VSEQRHPCDRDLLYCNLCGVPAVCSTPDADGGDDLLACDEHCRHDGEYGECTLLDQAEGARELAKQRRPQFVDPLDALRRIHDLCSDKGAHEVDYAALMALASTPKKFADLLAAAFKRFDETQSRPKVGVGVLVRRNGGRELLMGLRKGAHGAGTWSVPGGHLEAGERIVQAAVRELVEETGLVPSAPQSSEVALLDEYTYVDMGPGRAYVTLYAAVDFYDHVEAELREPDKIAEFRWVSKGEGLLAPTFEPLQAFVDKLGASSRLWSVGRNRKKGIYVASKTKHAEMWRTLRAQGLPVISTWIDEAGAGETGDWQDLWDRCLDEAASAAALVLYVEPGEQLKGAYAELGAALRAGVPVYWAGLAEPSISKHRLVTVVADVHEACAKAYEVAIQKAVSR
jgi:8-oxo-dGTP pyrophosphatase MutT (NUDIX family)